MTLSLGKSMGWGGRRQYEVGTVKCIGEEKKELWRGRGEMTWGGRVEGSMRRVGCCLR